MKNLANKERRRDREEFCYRYRSELLESFTDTVYWGSPKAKELLEKARTELGYSRKTVDCDIYCSLRKTLIKLP